MDVSILIPVKNGSQWIDTTLKTIFAQKTLHSYEVIVVDSGSVDNTVSIVRNYNVRLYQILAQEFGHGKTRNYLARLSRAEKYIIFLNQDAVPSDEYWLDNMVKSIEFYPDLKAACAMEVYNNQVYGVAGVFFKSLEMKKVHIIEPYLLSKLQGLSHSRKRGAFAFTTVCAIFDKQHFEKYPFDDTSSFGEDLQWSVTNSNLGYKAACSSFAKVQHGHTEAHRKSNHEKRRKLYKEVFGKEPINAAFKKRIKESSLYLWLLKCVKMYR